MQRGLLSNHLLNPGSWPDREQNTDGITAPTTQNTRRRHPRYILIIVNPTPKFEHLVELAADSAIKHKQYKPENLSNFVEFHSRVPEDQGNRLPPERDKANFCSLLWHNGNAALKLST
jgi:hypothetical protein